MKICHILLLPVLLATVLSAQVQVRPQGRSALQEALLLERLGNTESAKAMYREMLQANPAHTQAYQHLKTLLLREGELEQAADLIRTYLQHLPHDLQAGLELGAITYRLDRKEQAFQLWDRLERQTAGNRNTYGQFLQVYNQLSLPDRADSLVARGRRRFQDPAFLALELANYYFARRTFDRALDEYLVHLQRQPGRQKFVTDRILLISDEVEDQSLIEQRLLELMPQDTAIFREILAGYYFKLRRFQDAYDQHLLLGLNSATDYTRWLTLCKNLYLENEYSLAIRGYQHLLIRGSGNGLPARYIGEAMLGMGQCFEDQIIPGRIQPRLVHFYADNLIFEDHFYNAPTISTEPLQTAFRLYDSLLVTLPRSDFSPRAHFRLGEIKYRITRDFDGALTSYRAVLQSNPESQLRELTLLRIGDVYLAKGDLKHAREYFLDQFSARPGDQKTGPFLMRLIQANLLSNDLESALTLTETSLQDLPPGHALFNDLMEIQDLLTTHYLQGTETDRQAFRRFWDSELLIRQYKLSEAVKTLEFLREKYPRSTITPTATLRSALVQARLGHSQAALDLALALESSPLADAGLTLAAEIHELYHNNVSLALTLYHRLLESYPGSLLMEPVRFHIRELTQSTGS